MNGKKTGYWILTALFVLLLAISGFLGVSLASSRNDKSKLQRSFDTLTANNKQLREQLNSATSYLGSAKLEAQKARTECERATATNNELRRYIEKSNASRRELERLARSNSNILNECGDADASGDKLFAECFGYLRLLRQYFEGLEQASKAAGVN